MFPKLFEPFSIRSLTMRNRIVMPAMGTRMCDERAVTDKLVEYHRVRAAGGVGLSIVEVTAVHAPSSPTASCRWPRNASSRATSASPTPSTPRAGASASSSGRDPSPSPWIRRPRSSSPMR